MDEVDLRIIKALERNARTPYTEIAKELGLTEGAVRKRVERLVKTGVIKGFTIETGAVEAITLVAVDPSTLSGNAISSISKLEGVRRVYEVTGDFDVVVLISTGSVAAMNKCIDQIRSIPGVKLTKTMVVLRSYR
ncbi:MAG: Lrp/AsnC family transcriptional regulator [Candidatus Nezhaarchaeales archaeon]